MAEPVADTRIVVAQGHHWLSQSFQRDELAAGRWDRGHHGGRVGWERPKAEHGPLSRTRQLIRQHCPPQPEPVAHSGISSEEPVDSAELCDRVPSVPPTGPGLQPKKSNYPVLLAHFNRLLGSGLNRPIKVRDQVRKPRSTSDTCLHTVPRKVPYEGIPTHGDIIRTCSDLDKENAHFVVVDMVLEALEVKKLSMQGHWRGVTPEDGPKFCTRPYKKHSGSVVSWDTGCEGLSSLGSEAAPAPSFPPAKNEDGTRATGTECDDSSSPLHRPLQCPPIHCTAEALAQQLVAVFCKRWFPLEGQECSLQEFLPSSNTMEDNSALAEEIRQKTRMRGTLTWAPPRFQIIFNIHPPQKCSVVVASQNYLCAGCGTQVEIKYIRKLRYCEYLGRYFCDCCHGNEESVIPGRVLERWDFDRYPVCYFSKQLLDSVWHQPLFYMANAGKALRSKARELQRFQELQEQLIAIKKLLTACRLAGRVLQEFVPLPSHLTIEPFLLSLEDLVGLKRGKLVPQAKALLQVAWAHVEGCQLCQAKGFICEFCRKEEVLFPFQSHICKRCAECKACFHIDCFRVQEGCPKCARIQTRKQREDTFSKLVD